MSSSSSSHLPALPTETHAQILSYCDDQTLGRAGLVSPAILELASPFLYRHITITGFDQLVKLFYDDTRTSSAPHLDRFLSLDQTRTFTFIGKAELSYSIAFERTLTRTRSSCSFPIHVDTLTARFLDDDGYTGSLISSFLGLFSPRAVALASLLPSPPKVFYARINLDDAADWTALQTLTVSDLFWQGRLNKTEWFGRLKDRSLTLVVETPPPEASHWVLLDLWDTLSSEMLERDWSQLKEVVVKVSDEAQKQWLVDQWRSRASRRRHWSQAERNRQEAMIRYVVR